MYYETVSIKLIRYVDNNNQPTCAISFTGGHICHFYGTKKLGTQELCLYHNQALFRRNHNECGTLIPLSNCPLWKDNETKSIK